MVLDVYYVAQINESVMQQYYDIPGSCMYERSFRCDQGFPLLGKLKHQG